MNNNVVKSLRDVERVAKQMFPCAIKKIDEVHALGHIGIKIVVGFKPNPCYDPMANPDKPGLTPLERDSERNKAKYKVPDTRIIWMRPGITEQELVDEFLVGIQKSLSQKKVIVEPKKIEVSDKTEISEEELAEKLEKGESPEVELSGFEAEEEDMGFSDEDAAESIGRDNEPVNKPVEDYPEDESDDLEEDSEIENEKSEKSNDKQDQIIETLVGLTGAVNALGKNQNELAKRLEKVEKKKKK